MSPHYERPSYHRCLDCCRTGIFCYDEDVEPDFITAVKLHVYHTIAETGVAPVSTQIATLIGATQQEVESAFANLHQQKLLVPEPGDPSRIRMAPPFSGVPTAFPVVSGGKNYYSNCAWDAYGVLAALHQDGFSEASDAHTGEPIRLEVRDGAVVPQECVIHFAVPAALWWKDVIYT